MGWLVQSLLILFLIPLPLLEGKKKVTFIVNPVSGTGKQKTIEKTIEHCLDQTRFDYEILYTKWPNHATYLSRLAISRGAHIIVAVGGDGSVNEVAQEMIGTNCSLAIIPSGSGNGLARHFHISSNPAKAIQVINEMHEKWIDTVKINQKAYLSVAGIGFDANVSHAFSNRSVRGLLSYFFIVLSKLPLYKPQTYTLILDGKPIHKKAFLICFANGQQYGNNAFIAPHAKIDDGFLNVVIWKAFPPHAAPKLFHALFTKHIDDSKYTESYLCQEVILKKPLRTLFHIDGEPMEETADDVYIRILPSSLKIIIPVPT